MKPAIKSLLTHAAHVAAASAAAALLAWLSANQAQILAVVPPKYQAVALTALTILAALYKRSPRQPKL